MDPERLFSEKYISLMDSIESMATTISISNEMKEKLKNLGTAGESYEDVIRRMYEYTRKNILKDFLYDRTDSVTIDEALEEAKKRWPKS